MTRYTRTSRIGDGAHGSVALCFVTVLAFMGVLSTGCTCPTEQSRSFSRNQVAELCNENGLRLKEVLKFSNNRATLADNMFQYRFPLDYDQAPDPPVEIEKWGISRGDDVDLKEYSQAMGQWAKFAVDSTDGSLLWANFLYWRQGSHFSDTPRDRPLYRRGDLRAFGGKVEPYMKNMERDTQQIIHIVETFYRQLFNSSMSKDMKSWKWRRTLRPYCHPNNVTSQSWLATARKGDYLLFYRVRAILYDEFAREDYAEVLEWAKMPDEEPYLSSRSYNQQSFEDYFWTTFCELLVVKVPERSAPRAASRPEKVE
jgi:hypothetical protein